MTKRIFLIANNRNLTDQQIININNRFKIEENDLIVRFNHIESKTLQLFNGRTDIHVVRTKGRGFHGVNDRTKIIARYSKDIKHCFMICHDAIAQHKRIDEICKINDTTKNIIEIKEEYRKIVNKSPSTGFVAALYYLEKIPDCHIYLIAYTFHDLRNNRCHNFEKEYEYMNDISTRYNIEIVL